MSEGRRFPRARQLPMVVLHDPTRHRPRGPSHDVGATLAALPAGEYPLTVDVAAEMGAYGSDQHYDFVLDQLINGPRTVDAS